MKTEKYDVCGVILKSEVEEWIPNKTYLRVICDKNDEIKPGDVVRIILVANKEDL